MTGIYRLYFRAPHHPWETAYLRIVRHSRALHPLVPHIHNRAYALRQCTACGRLHYRCFQFIKDRIKGKSCFRATKKPWSYRSFKVLRWWTVQDSNLWPPARQPEFEFFYNIFRLFWPFPFRYIWFPALFKSVVSAYSTQVCGWLCGQSPCSRVDSAFTIFWSGFKMWANLNCDRKLSQILRCCYQRIPQVK